MIFKKVKEFKYEIIINNETISLHAKSKSSLYLISQFMFRYAISSFSPYLESKEGELEISYDPILMHKRQQMLNVLKSENKETKNEFDLFRTIDTWCLNGFEFEKRQIGYVFNLNNGNILIREDNVSILMLVFRRYFFSRKIISDYANEEKISKIFNIINFLVTNKLHQDIQEEFLEILIYCFNQCRNEPKQAVWPFILNLFINEELIERDKAIPIKELIIEIFKENNFLCEKFHLNILYLLNSILMRNLAPVTHNDMNIFLIYRNKKSYDQKISDIQNIIIKLFVKY